MAIEVAFNIHTGEKNNCDICEPYHCDICGKILCWIETQTYSYMKPYPCDICGKSFSVSSSLTTHKYS
ncbi:---NA--- [Octopus vulgaris]|uniref:---NA n=1 Tax=Octopus vulgaris TaxID=6645 RepID=A0AA36FQA8_OCTVU|nr:---NA--- [Octopus vulgaris]